MAITIGALVAGAWLYAAVALMWYLADGFDTGVDDGD